MHFSFKKHYLIWCVCAWLTITLPLLLQRYNFRCFELEGPWSKSPAHGLLWCVDSRNHQASKRKPSLAFSEFCIRAPFQPCFVSSQWMLTSRGTTWHMLSGSNRISLSRMGNGHCGLDTQYTLPGDSVQQGEKETMKMKTKRKSWMKRCWRTNRGGE